MTTHQHGGHPEPPAPPERINRTFTIHLAVSVDRASWAAAYGGEPEDDFTVYVRDSLVTGLRRLISSIEEHDGRVQISVRP